MASIRDARKLVAWQLCAALDSFVFRMTASGSVTTDGKVRDQLRSSAGAPAPQIAEGFGRGGPREFAICLRMAVSSLMLTQTYLQKGLDHGDFTPKMHADAARLCGRALRMTQRLLASTLRQVTEAEEAKRRSRRATDY